VEDMGKNSVMPSTIAIIKASNQLITKRLIFFWLFHNGPYLKNKSRKDNHGSQCYPAKAENFMGIENVRVFGFASNHQQKANNNYNESYDH
jgi:hypothetical protein